MDGEKDFPAFDALYRINLRNREIRMLLYINLIIQIGSASPTLLVDLPVFSALAFGKTNPAWQVKISCGKKIVIDQSVESAFTDHNGIPVVLEDMVEGLPFQDQRGDDRIQMPDFIFGKRDPFPCL